MNSRRWALTLTGSLAPLLLAFVWLETLRSEAEHPPVPEPPRNLPQMVLHEHLERVRTRGGEVSWQLRADTVQVLESGDYLIQGVRRGQYLSEGVVEVEFSADRARLEARTQNIAVAGRVEVTARRGVSFAADTIYWSEAEGRMFVPRVERLRWEAPDKPGQSLTIDTGRLFFWPREKRLELPDKLTASHAADRLEAASATASLETLQLALAGPAEVAVMAALTPPSGPAQPIQKRITLTVGEGGQIAYDGRAGSAVVRRRVVVGLPAEQLTVTCEQAVWSGPPEETVTITGGLRLTDPTLSVAAGRALVRTKQRQATLSGGIDLRQLGPDPLTLRCASLTYWFETGRRRAATGGPVRLTSGAIAGSARRATVDLEAETATLSGPVELTHTPRVRAEADANEWERAAREPVTLTCDQLVHRFARGARYSTATGSPKFRQADRRGSARRAEFDHEREILTLEGQVHVKNKAGEEARCVKATYDLREQALEIRAPATASVFLRDEP